LFNIKSHDVMRIPRLHSFLLPHTYQWSSGQWKQFFSTATFQQHLRVLRTSNATLQECDGALLLQQAPLLHTLQFALCRYHPRMRPDYEPPLLSALPKLLNLTDLRVIVHSHARTAPALSCALQLAECVHLHTLHLQDASQTFVCALLSAGGLKCLQHLRLIDIAAHAVAATLESAVPVANGIGCGQCTNGWRSAMQTLAAAATLRTLTLQHVRGIDALLEHAPLLSSSLQLLRVHPSSIPSPVQPLCEHSAPSVPRLRALLFALPSTQLVLNQLSTCNDGQHSASWLQLAEQWNELSKAHPRQLTVLEAGVRWSSDDATDALGFW
jgi:hypothetical protein